MKPPFPWRSCFWYKAPKSEFCDMVHRTGRAIWLTGPCSCTSVRSQDRLRSRFGARSQPCRDLSPMRMPPTLARKQLRLPTAGRSENADVLLNIHDRTTHTTSPAFLRASACNTDRQSQRACISISTLGISHRDRDLSHRDKPLRRASSCSF